MSRSQEGQGGHFQVLGAQEGHHVVKVQYIYIYIYLGLMGNDEAYILAFGMRSDNEDFASWNILQCVPM